MPKFVSVFLFCFIGGVGLASLYLISETMLWSGLAIGMFFAMVLVLLSRQASGIIACAILGAVFGVWYVNQSFAQNEYEQFLNKPIETEGVIVADPITSARSSGGESQQITILPDGFTQYIRASMYTPIPNAQKGDRVWIRGQLELPENFSDFDYVGYLQRWQVYAVLKKPRVIVLERANFNWRTPLLELRAFVIKQSKVFPQSEGSLVVGMLIGQRQHIPQKVADAFKITGLTHIVAVSGFNMSIIATACGAFVWYIGRRATNILTIVIVFGFTVITGASAAVVRAAIMAVIMVTAQLLGRQYASMYSLLVVASIMVFINPRIVIWDVGFQLSVAATYGVLIAFRLKKPGTPNTFLGDLLRPTFGAMMTTSPIIAYHFKTFSLIAPLANLLVLPLVPWIMLLGALSLLPILGIGFVVPAQLVTSSVLLITQWLAEVPHASVNINLPIWALVMYYAVVFAYINATLRKRGNNAKLQKIIS